MSSEARQTLDANISERDFQAQVVDLARLCGWLCYHTFDSRRSEPGYPDLCLVHQEREELIYAELKTERGKLSADQRKWLQALQQISQWAVAVRPIDDGDYGATLDHDDSATECYFPIRVYVWRPSDWPEIRAVLTGEE